MTRLIRMSFIVSGLLVLLLGRAAVGLEGARSATVGLLPETERITAETLRAHISFLASDSLGGRHLGSPGLDKAMQYAEHQLSAAGLAAVVGRPAPAIGGLKSGADGLKTKTGPAKARIQGEPAGGYFQPVPIVQRTATGSVTMRIKERGKIQSFVQGEDFKVILGDMRPCEGRPLPVVFAGYGISEPELGWDDLKGLDLRGKAVVFLPGAPLKEGEPILPASIHAQYARVSSIMKKVFPLFFKRPAALLIVADDEIESLWDAVPAVTDAPHFAYGNEDPEALHFCCICIIRPSVVKALFAGQTKVPVGSGFCGTPGRSISGAQRGSVDSAGPSAPPAVTTSSAQETAQGFALKNVSLTLDGEFTEESVPAGNMVGIVRGSDPSLARQCVVLTAHLDTNPPSNGEIMNGADDNASGCAALFEIAGAVASNPPKRSVVFVLFCGEEGGSIGARHFVSSCPIPVSSIVADINLDGIGRSDSAETERTVFALDSGKFTPALTRLIGNVNARTVNWPIKYEYMMGYSDNLMFHAVGIPAANFYSGHHEDVNMPTDDIEKIDFEKAEKVSRLVYELTMELANSHKLWR